MKKNNMPLNLRERINSRISLLCSVIVLVLLVLVMHQMDYTLIRKPQKEAAEAAALKEQQDKIKAETPVISTASVIAVGDNLYHSKLYESGENDSGIWNYDHIYTHVLDQIQAADVAMIGFCSKPRCCQHLSFFCHSPGSGRCHYQSRV